MLSSAHYGLHWPTWQSVPFVIACTVVFGFVLALPSLRLSGDYFAIVMLFFLLMFNNFTSNGYVWDWFGLGAPHDVTGGPTGITNIDPWRVFGHVLNPNSPENYLWAATAGFFVIAILLTYVNKSRTGRAWRALREDPLAANLMGMPVKWLGLLAIAVGAGVAGFAGTVNASYYQGVFPDAITLQLLITIYAMVILGGAGSLGGVVFGAVTVNVLLEILRPPTTLAGSSTAVTPGLIAKLRPWKRLAALVVGTVALGYAVHTVAAAVSPAWTPPSAGVRGWLLRAPDEAHLGTYAYVALILAVLALLRLNGWRRDAVAVVALYLAVFEWETVLVEQPSITRVVLLGAVLVALTVARPQGLFGQPRVDAV